MVPMEGNVQMRMLSACPVTVAASSYPGIVALIGQDGEPNVPTFGTHSPSSTVTESDLVGTIDLSGMPVDEKNSTTGLTKAPRPRPAERPRVRSTVSPLLFRADLVHCSSEKRPDHP